LDRWELLEIWIDAYMNRLLRVSFLYLQNKFDAEDCVQNTFLKAYAHMDQLHRLDNPFPWLTRITINESKQFHRKQRREILGNAPTLLEQESAESAHLRDLRDRSVYYAVLALPEKYRAPIALFYFEELSTQEIGQILGVNPATVRTQVSRGRRLLQKRLKEVGVDEFGSSVVESETST